MAKPIRMKQNDTAATRPVRVTPPLVISISGTSANTSSALGEGLYEIAATVDCEFKQCKAAASTATWGSDHILFGGMEKRVAIRDDDDTFFAVITGGASGKFYIAKIGD